jgi:hypothetical protein
MTYNHASATSTNVDSSNRPDRYQTTGLAPGNFISGEVTTAGTTAHNITITYVDDAGNSAEAAAAYLAKIDPNSSCYAEAKVLNDKMAKRVKEIDQREWNFALKQQQDQVDIEKATIKAARDIGVAYGENQPDVIYETAIYGWW